MLPQLDRLDGLVADVGHGRAHVVPCPADSLLGEPFFQVLLLSKSDILDVTRVFRHETAVHELQLPVNLPHLLGRTVRVQIVPITVRVSLVRFSMEVVLYTYSSAMRRELYSEMLGLRAL